MGSTMEELQGAAKYFGERFDAMDPCRTLRIVGDFLNLFDRALSNIKVGFCAMFHLSVPPFCA